MPTGLHPRRLGEALAARVTARMPVAVHLWYAGAIRRSVTLFVVPPFYDFGGECHGYSFVSQVRFLPRQRVAQMVEQRICNPLSPPSGLAHLFKDYAA